ncbi:major histocompatibility complex class I-related gene protein-like isoform X2 [Archocentrus centrarchus]|uniref:major histocompatibility complex class I-related gene protein-like isoform X2 n=1 Tax=Archocentrus centrarchus TaxID=63155 RepID=UPI0011E9D79A|nr:major histocompatibility complex class I-related gene protein-like isoform X2 [Archocentrus centrarchus]
MKTLMMLIVLCHTASAVSHSLTFFCTESPGAQGIPEFVSVGLVDEVQIVDCNNIRGLEVHKDWNKFFKDDPQHVEWYASQCLNNHHFFKANIESLRQRLNQTEGVHIMQRMCGCEWDDETGELNGFNQFGYDAEDFIALDLQTLTWIAPKPQALITKLRWDTEKARLEANKYILGHECPKYLKKYVQYGKNLLESAVLPSVSLLQKSPSSPISCHATGFYPHRAMMFWRKDGEEIHEGVDHREILPNNDGTFQMSVDLKLSSVTLADWERYDCVFHLSDVSSDIITKLDKAVIRTNMEKPTDMVISISAAVVVLALILIAAAAFVAHKKKKAECSPSCADNDSEQSERLNTQS